MITDELCVQYREEYDFNYFSIFRLMLFGWGSSTLMSSLKLRMGCQPAALRWWLTQRRSSSSGDMDKRWSSSSPSSSREMSAAHTHTHTHVCTHTHTHTHIHANMQIHPEPHRHIKKRKNHTNKQTHTQGDRGGIVVRDKYPILPLDISKIWRKTHNLDNLHYWKSQNLRKARSWWLARGGPTPGGASQPSGPEDQCWLQCSQWQRQS